MPPRTPHIVLVEDDSYLTESRKAILETNGYSVEIVGTVREARQRCRTLRCDLVIVDAKEKHDTALELCEEIKLHNPKLCVALMTGYYVYLHSECPDEVIRKDEGPQGFLAKVSDLLTPSIA